MLRKGSHVGGKMKKELCISIFCAAFSGLGCLNQASFEEKKWDAMCTQIHDCLNDDELGAVEFLLGDVGDDVGQCRQVYDEDYKEDFEANEECEFDSDGASECIDKLKKASCSDYLEVLFSRDCTDVCD